MKTRTVRLIDDSRTVFAVAQVTDEGGHFGGVVDLTRTPQPLRSVFEEFEEVVNGQMFSFLDQVQAKIEALGIRAVFDDGREQRLTDVQIYPSTSEVSFRAVGEIGRKT